MKYPIKVELSASGRAASFDFNNIEFGPTATDHLFSAEYRDSHWENAVLKPFTEFLISPLALCLHYGQTVFEGMKAFRLADGRVSVFRPDKHLVRLNRSLERMCMPLIDEELFIGGLESLVRIDEQWVSGLPGNSLYLRPMVIASEPRLGVREASEYRFMIIALPMANYYHGPVKVKVETEFTRAAAGGAGFAKNGGNYAASFLPARLAREQGFDQVLWTDSRNHEFMEESGTMNVMFVIDQVLVTPPLTGTILDGVTRDSILSIARDLGIRTEERPISYKELVQAFEYGSHVEAFGVGTAAVLTLIAEIDILGTCYTPVANGDTTALRLRDALEKIRTGLLPDMHSWNYIIG